jgi:predicted dehydrogenase
VAYPGARLVHSGVHFFDLFRFFGAGEPVAVFGRLETGADDDDPPGSGYVEFTSGIRAYIDARSRVAHGYLELHGTTGVARVGNDASCTMALWDLPPATSPTDRFYQPRLQPGMWRRGDYPGAERLTDGRNITNLCVDEVLACLDEHRPSISSLEDGLRAQEIATAIYVSHQAGGQLVRLPLPQRDLALRAI